MRWTVVLVAMSAAFANSLHNIRQNGLCGYADSSGAIVIPVQYEDCGELAEGLAPVRLEGKWGYVDKHGGWAAAPLFESAQMLTDGRGLVKVNGKFGFVDSGGALVVAAKYDEAVSFSEELAAVRQGARWGYIDRSGNTVIPLRFDSAQSFADGVAIVSSDSRLFAINRKGEAVSARPPAITVTFCRLQSLEADSLDSAALVVSSLYKEQLRELAAQTLAQFTEPDIAAGKIKAGIEHRLKETGIRFSVNPEKETRSYGLIAKVEVIRPVQHPELLAIIFHFDLGGNIDSSFSLFGRSQSGWDLLVRDEHIPTPNSQMLWADTWHVAAPDFTANERDGSFIMLLCSDSDRGADGGYGIEIQLRRFDAVLRSHQIFTRQFAGKNHQIALDGDSLRLEVADFTHDSARGATRVYPYRYRIRGDEVTRIAPVAFSAHDFVEEWGNLTWNEAVRWADTKNADSLQQWHEKIRDPNGYFGGEFNTQVCDTKQTVWQIAVDQLGDGGVLERSTYFIVKQTGKWDFVMKAVSDKPMDGCEEYEPERMTDWRKQPTMFDQPTETP
ncbi:MAG: WG repeat-containing protein [Bryobacteraceae bacterium]|jgi:hypothetical protein